MATPPLNWPPTDNRLSFRRDRAWPFWPIFPLYPYGQRRTLRQEVVKNTIWTFDQFQGILYVVVPIRMTVVRLESGGLLVYAPVAPTRECLRLLNELVAQHGEVKYIILPTGSGLEHKVFIGPFARRFPQARVFVAPGQWSYPLNLPLTWLGFPGDRTEDLLAESSQTPFADEFDYAILGPISLGLGKFTEVALFHRRTRTLLLTDAIVSVPQDPPAVLQEDPYPLLFHARDTTLDEIEDTDANRRKGWQRICLFALYFQPSALDVIPWGRAFREASQARDRSRKAYFGLFPFRWKPHWQQSFNALNHQYLFVAPILQTLILNRDPQATLAWVDRVASWQFQQIIPCHFTAPISATPNQFKQAFSFLKKNPYIVDPTLARVKLPLEDFEFLEELDATLNQRGVTPPAKEKV
ncbi:MAG: DUF4336 domain-containing protein [Cyanobacteria bacterium J007]|nr:MAG: DUF4336 domain-containing protein [Cyanobacteria bacterium J007]